MIAPLGQTQRPTTKSRRRLRRAHRLLAHLFLESSPQAEAPRPVSTWKAWIFVAWVVVVTGVYFATMLGLL